MRAQIIACLITPASPNKVILIPISLIKKWPAGSMFVPLHQFVPEIFAAPYKNKNPVRNRKPGFIL